MIREILLPLDKKTVSSLNAGDSVLLTGVMYTARDAAHKRLIAALEAGEKLPFDIENQTIYYVGPAPATPGHAVGSCGPTSSYRMDAYTLPLLKRGLCGMIGKGKRSPAVVEGMKTYGAVYFGAVGGAAALIARSVKRAEVVAYPDLGAEAVHRFTVERFPAIVLIDSKGVNLYETGPAKYREEL